MLNYQKEKKVTQGRQAGFLNIWKTSMSSESSLVSAEAALLQVSYCDNQTAVLGRGMMIHYKSQPCKHETSITQGLVGGRERKQLWLQRACVLAGFAKRLNGFLPLIANRPIRLPRLNTFRHADNLLKFKSSMEIGEKVNGSELEHGEWGC